MSTNISKTTRYSRLCFDLAVLPCLCAFSAVGWRQEGHPACKKPSGGCWCGYLSGARCRLAYGPADTTATHCLASVKSRLVLPFWYRLTLVVPEKGPLNGCVCTALPIRCWPGAGAAGRSHAAETTHETLPPWRPHQPKMLGRAVLGPQAR